MIVTLHIQNAADHPDTPNAVDLKKWVTLALQTPSADTELTVRIVDKTESAALNERYRHKTGPTNVLSFPADVPAECELAYLGDLVICAQVLSEEALAQHKDLTAHWAHIVIHGTLHLLGYDHHAPQEAARMESLEITLLNTLGYADPYTGSS